MSFKHRPRVALVLVASWFCIGDVAIAMAAPEAVPGFNREIRPILSDRCFFCHGPDKAKRKSGLRLDDRAAAIEAGAIVPGKPEESEVWKRITTSDADDVMPPPDAHKTLTAAEVELLRRWIAGGAPYEPHWAYVPIARPDGPSAAAKGSAAIDAFVQQRLASKQLQPSPPANRRTLLRRLSLDLTGLPPTPEQLRAFEQDTRPDAWERQVNRLLADPHYGERMAVPWLDVVRFADTVGYHGDQNQHVFPYRDYVINAFNSNKPFDRFTIEQVAGDLLPKPSTEALVASGFNRLNMVSREGGVQPAEYLAKYMADRVRAVGTAWLGSTLGCAQCHDHKYDPIEIKDFYSMGAFFADIREWGVYADYPYTPNPDLAAFGNEHPFPPEMSIKSSFLLEQGQELQRQKTDAWRKLHETAAAPALRPRMEAWMAQARAFTKDHPEGWQPLTPKVVRTDQKISAEVEADGTTVIKDTASSAFWEWPAVELELPQARGTVAALRMDLVPHAAHGGRHLRGGKAAGEISVSAYVMRGETKTPLRFYDGHASVEAPNWRNGHRLPNIARGWRTPSGYVRDRLSGVWEFTDPVVLADGDRLFVRVSSLAVGAMKFSVSPFAGYAAQAAPSHWGRAAPDPDTAPTALGAFLKVALAKAPSVAVREVWLLSDAGVDSKLLAEVRRLHDAWQAVKDGEAETVIAVSQKPRTTRVLPRGNWQDNTGEVVQPAVPHFLPQLPATATANGRRATRLDLAQWLVSPTNPLTARAFMNRMWKQFFGTGLSLVLDDLGGQGEPPTHPELLDWLAAEFIQSGWNVKHMVKLLVMSRTYQQDSAARPELLAVDPQNRLLARQSQRRLDAEFVRDNALFVSGLLNAKIGGPSAFPYQPDGYYDNLEFPARTYVNDLGPLQHRRGVYTHWQRTFLHPMLANFDAPSREECTADRPYSNTPQQALTLLNDPTFVEAARALAARLLQARKRTDEQRLTYGFELATGRPPSAAELQSLRSLLSAQEKHYAAHPEQAQKLLGPLPTPTPQVSSASLAAWTSVSRALLNLYETITRV